MKLTMWDFWEYFVITKFLPKSQPSLVPNPPAHRRSYRRCGEEHDLGRRRFGSVHPSSQLSEDEASKFQFCVRRRGRRWTRNVFLYYFMKWNILSFLQIWLFSYLPCLLIYNYYLQCYISFDAWKIGLNLIRCCFMLIDMSFVSVYVFVLYWCVWDFVNRNSILNVNRI